VHHGCPCVVETYFVEPEEGEEPDVVTLRTNYVRLLEENDRLLQELTRLREELAKVKSGAAWHSVLSENETMTGMTSDTAVGS
jgi:hypothetical protein